jgi:pimeloyl-ACP methyl ester carboxylesterase
LINFRKYGKSPFNLALLHGGPGAVGDLVDVASELSSKVGVIELLQTGYTIGDLISESVEVISNHGRFPIILAGHSWGAWLGILISEKHPDLVKKLILISSGPFDKSYTRNIMSKRIERLNLEERNVLTSLLDKLKEERCDKNITFKNIGEILSKADTFQSTEDNPPDAQFNYSQYESIWPLASHLRDSGKLLSAASMIKCPVVAIHGYYDPHPAEGVKNPLSKTIKDFRFSQLEKCGHYPWREKYAKARFYSILNSELAK